MAKGTGTAGRAGTTEALAATGLPESRALQIRPGENVAPEVVGVTQKAVKRVSMYEGPSTGPEAQARFRRNVEWDERIKIGDKVQVRWGYGSGFRARGLGTVVRVSPASLQVKLDEDVMSPYRKMEVGWPKGFTLKGIARFGSFNGRWNFWNSVEPR